MEIPHFFAGTKTKTAWAAKNLHVAMHQVGCVHLNPKQKSMGVSLSLQLQTPSETMRLELFPTWALNTFELKVFGALGSRVW